MRIPFVLAIPIAADLVPSMALIRLFKSQIKAARHLAEARASSPGGWPPRSHCAHPGRRVCSARLENLIQPMTISNLSIKPPGAARFWRYGLPLVVVVAAIAWVSPALLRGL